MFKEEALRRSAFVIRGRKSRGNVKSSEKDTERRNIKTTLYKNKRIKVTLSIQYITIITLDVRRLHIYSMEIKQNELLPMNSLNYASEIETPKYIYTHTYHVLTC